MPQLNGEITLLEQIDENILPSLTSPRNTTQNKNAENEEHKIGTVNVEKKRLLDLNFSELLSSPGGNEQAKIEKMAKNPSMIDINKFSPAQE